MVIRKSPVPEGGLNVWWTAQIRGVDNDLLIHGLISLITPECWIKECHWTEEGARQDLKFFMRMVFTDQRLISTRGHACVYGGGDFSLCIDVKYNQQDFSLWLLSYLTKTPL